MLFKTNEDLVPPFSSSEQSHGYLIYGYIELFRHHDLLFIQSFVAVQSAKDTVGKVQLSTNNYFWCLFLHSIIALSRNLFPFT